MTNKVYCNISDKMILSKKSMTKQSSKIIKKDLSKFKKTPNIADYERAYKDFSWENAKKQYIDFFEDGTMNASYNMVDRHVEKVNGGKKALIFHTANGEKENYSFLDLQKLSNKFAN